MRLSKIIKDDFFVPVNSYKTTVFLCGATLTDKEKIRSQIANHFTSDGMNSFFYDIVFPEDIFDDLLYSSRRMDLLSLENMLAESVDVIVVIPESPGSFAELGAFANDEKLRKKLICLVNNKYKKDKSFINEGPVKLIRKANKDGVIFIDNNDVEKSFPKLLAVIRKIKKSSKKRLDKVSLLQLENFLLPSIFLLEPVSKKILQEMTAYAIGDENNAYQATTTALTVLTKKRMLEMTSEGYKLTLSGINSFIHWKTPGAYMKSLNKRILLDNVRLEILNYKLRNKKINV